jgi:hypothetical protein
MGRGTTRQHLALGAWIALSAAILAPRAFPQEATQRAPAAESARLETERVEYLHAIASNPGYFIDLEAKAAKGTAPPRGNVSFEELTCVGLHPDLNLLEATVEIKRASGYRTGLCGPGSQEYVRFFIDYGVGWEDMGYAAFNAHDIPTHPDCEKKADKPLHYVVTLPIQPRRKACFLPVLPKVRAILSWEAIPTGPNFPVVWGNGLDRHIQIKPRPWIFTDFVDRLGTTATTKIPPEFEAVKTEPIPMPEPSELELGELVKLYRPDGGKGPAATVEAHRFGLPDLERSLTANALAPDVLGSTVAAWKGLGLDFDGSLGTLEQQSGLTTYEELDCLGLDGNLDRLVATFRVKKSQGYSGPPCSAGSREFVAFWADWENRCQWTYLGTTQTSVHDYDPLPAGGLHYAAMLRVDLSPWKRSCQEPRIARVRAVLSWNTPPSTLDPDRLPYWGNRVDVHVQIRPGRPTQGPEISIIGGVGVSGIDTAVPGGTGLTLSNAVFAETGANVEPWNSTRQCPFGGDIRIHGPPLVGLRYRVIVRRSGTSSEIRVTNPIYTLANNGVGTFRYADPDEAFAYLSPQQNVLDVLGLWTSSGDALWEVRVQAINASGAEVASSVWYGVHLDNTAPSAEISIDGGACDPHGPGSPLTGRFVARDANFGKFILETLPASLSPPAPTTATPPTSPTTVSPGDAWALASAGLTPCGYVVRVLVWDRAIVNSLPGIHNSNADDAGFCILPQALTEAAGKTSAKQ